MNGEAGQAPDCIGIACVADAKGLDEDILIFLELVSQSCGGALPTAATASAKIVNKISKRPELVSNPSENVSN